MLKATEPILTLFDQAAVEVCCTRSAERWVIIGILTGKRQFYSKSHALTELIKSELMLHEAVQDVRITLVLKSLKERCALPI